MPLQSKTFPPDTELLVTVTGRERLEASLSRQSGDQVSTHLYQSYCSEQYYYWYNYHYGLHLDK